MDSDQSIADRVRQRRGIRSIEREDNGEHNLEHHENFVDANELHAEGPADLLQPPSIDPTHALAQQFAELAREFRLLREREQHVPTPREDARRERLDVIRPPFYDGTTPWDEYWSQFRAIMVANGWGPETAAVRLMAALRGTALAAVCNVPDDQRHLFAMEDALSRRFGTQGQARLFLTRLRQRVQGNSEDVAAFAADVESLARRAMPTEDAREAVAVEQFLNGLRSQRVRELVISSDPSTLREAVTRAATLEAGLFSGRLQPVRSTTFEDEKSSIRQLVNEQVERFLAPSEPAIAEDEMICRLVREELQKRRAGLKCFKCGKLGHFRWECKEQIAGNE
ncbi:hypothetical protein GE061_006245 [Apolygus lucorum]|uniref:CCHC-type domain-containing protein n=1 Tax=Apolygus lucorum TaxID=248454 RepID=A0A8S9WTE9_APOLU|nr:hypothetical protein GE061_006245 [Apolygus lucorum]